MRDSIENTDATKSQSGDGGTAAPKVFISYSWTNTAHTEWVLQLATDLKNLGVDVVIDRWHLIEGQDAHAFMERMVRSDEITKIILVCDQKYVDRANGREGGVGIESQIVTAQLYGDVEQTKVVGIVVESDESGAPTVPIFLQNRIFIDFRDADAYSSNLQQLVRWAFNKPLFREPAVGPRPKFVDDQVEFDPIKLSATGARGRNTSPVGKLISFMNELARQRSDFTVGMSDDEAPDESVFRAIKALGALTSQVLNKYDEVLAERELTEGEIESTVSYFEAVFSHYSTGGTQWSGDATKFYGQFLLTALLARFVRHRAFESAQALLGARLIKLRYGEMTAEDYPLRSLNEFLSSLDHRNSRLKLQRASLHADLIRDLCDELKLEFVEYIQADLILFLALSDWDDGRIWWPDSALYVADSHGTLPWFVRAKQPAFRDKLFPLFGVRNSSDLSDLIESIRIGKVPEVRWRSAFSTLNLTELLNLQKVSETY
uniref:SEFIR domain-containing protein n=1 Tax=Parerythrobacter lutipelagi TaxID=1964208 RepID=UPI0010F5CAB5|nr:SEFIR domain-containing protein [Parerythrobacter lutipelagi]